MRTKAKRQSGRKYTKIYDPVNVPYEEVYWDDWDDWRDGFRDQPKDKKLILAEKRRRQAKKLKRCGNG